MGKLSIEKQAALIKAFGYERASKMILEFERQDTAPPDATSKDLGVVYKSQRPQPTLADLQQQQKALNKRIKALSQSQKDAQQAAEAEAVQRVMLLASNLNLSENAVTELIRQYSIGEVTAILTTLSNTKAAKGYFVDPFFGTRITRLTAQDVATYIAQKSKSDRDTFFK